MSTLRLAYLEDGDPTKHAEPAPGTPHRGVALHVTEDDVQRPRYTTFRAVVGRAAHQQEGAVTLTGQHRWLRLINEPDTDAVELAAKTGAPYAFRPFDLYEVQVTHPNVGTGPRQVLPGDVINLSFPHPVVR